MKRTHLFCFVLLVSTVLASCKNAIEAPLENTNLSPSKKNKQETGITAAVNYYIPHKGISDHSNASINGSIAWYLSQYGAGTASSPNIFYLTSDTSYVCSNSIIMPAY